MLNIYTHKNHPANQYNNCVSSGKKYTLHVYTLLMYIIGKNHNLTKIARRLIIGQFVKQQLTF